MKKTLLILISIVYLLFALYLTFVTLIISYVKNGGEYNFNIFHIIIPSFFVFLSWGIFTQKKVVFALGSFTSIIFALLLIFFLRAVVISSGGIYEAYVGNDIQIVIIVISILFNLFSSVFLWKASKLN